ncbi:isopentenyl diphosphate isomerase/L-lactate dehydrogenase-like FMN-dependent dehydrogenase [Desulfobotulus alkaliphilus]|uniref:Isopentenyl diphosphate isomerase/L-lactate dehydrogenase-like FMN-dependent dehydrogenase n=1 Tax=Desulfobotulus alkaliphilus TaxID=622671 RepID=A0A562RWD4_9BACT|nr:alpha-hydroxy-acid oxidizing protein [Desulfobotulus alkaliphilus]TWI73203.1 isopentenyl diphosphate isomerase/L-lactate dehydrogenase-like FMN-dependent dehydrogenase [Desulfobotulus alkaliphilus]
MKSIRDTAREKMTGYCRVCPICNGKNCASGVPGMGGLGTGEAFRANGEALADIRLNMRLIHDITEPDTRTELFGTSLDFPLLAAPIGGVSYNMGGAIPEAAYIHAIVDGCRKEGLIGCTGDGVPPEISQCGFEAVKAAEGLAIPFIKPWEDKELFEKLDKALACNPMAIGMDIDAAGLITLRLQGRPVSPKSISKLREVRKHIQRPFILKGIMTPDQAELAMDAGADAIVVSNHGGRVLDMTPGTADVLPEIVETVGGKIRVLVDGGIRSGVDILKMLALGADAVLIGRPFSIAACGGESEGVCTYIRQLRTELKQAMVMTGCASIADVDESILY